MSHRNSGGEFIQDHQEGLLGLLLQETSLLVLCMQMRHTHLHFVTVPATP